MSDIVERLREFSNNCLKLEAAGGNEGAWLQIAGIQKDAAAEIERLRDAGVIARTTQANLQSEIDRLRDLVRQVARSSWPPPPSWYAEAQEAAMLESGQFVRSQTAIPRDEDGAA